MKMKKSNNSRRSLLVFIQEYGTRQRLLIAAVAGTFLLNVLFLILASQFHSSEMNRRMKNVQAGAVAEYDYIAGQDLTYTDVERTEELRDEKAETVLPVYTVDESVILAQLESFERFTAFFLADHQKLSDQELARELNLRFAGNFSEQDVEILRGSGALSRFLPLVEEELRNLMEKGVFPSIPDSRDPEEVYLELWYWKGSEKVHEPYKGSQIVNPENIDDRIEGIFSSYNPDSSLEAAGLLLIKKFLTQTAFFDPTLTRALQQKARDMVQPVLRKVAKGEKIFQAGDVITRDDMKTVYAFMDLQPTVSFQGIGAIIIYTGALFFLAYIMYAPLLSKGRRTYQHSYILLIASIVFTLNIFLIRAFSLIPVQFPLSIGVITALICMMIATLLTQRIGIISALLFSLLFFTLPDIEIFSFIFSFFSGITATYVIRNAERRIDLVSGTIWLALILIFTMMVIGLFQQKEFGWYLSAAGIAVLYAFVTGSLNLALLPAIEHLLNAPTVFRLRELSDTNTPVFKRMITVAPGTYSHSMSVANLAESACREIGANHLLARVGAYYHDIGKMDKPDYFIENQQEKNKHDDLTPNLSVAVIKSHVKIGKERAKELKLPPEVVEIVSDHHGSDVISYFYQQAVKKNRTKVTPEEFSYNGTPPRSKESAIVMLADTIEAQSRTVKKPSVQKFEKMVWDAIMLKVSRKQLSNSVLSFQDIEKIKNSFVQILAGQFHNRIEYPEQKDNK